MVRGKFCRPFSGGRMAASEAITHERSRSRILDGRITDTGRRSRSLQSGLQPARMYQAWICYRKASARGSSEIAARSPGMVVVGAVVAPTRARSFRLSIPRDADREWRLFTLQSPRERSAISVKVAFGASRPVPVAPSLNGRYRFGEATFTGTHMWTAPVSQGLQREMTFWSIAVICPAFVCGTDGRWPRWGARIGSQTRQ